MVNIFFSLCSTYFYFLKLFISGCAHICCCVAFSLFVRVGHFPLCFFWCPGLFHRGGFSWLIFSWSRRAGLQELWCTGSRHNGVFPDQECQNPVSHALAGGFFTFGLLGSPSYFYWVICIFPVGPSGVFSMF